MIIDTHAHYDDDRFDEDRDEILSHLPEAGVKWVLNVGAMLPGAEASVALAGKYEHVYAAVGIHPDDVDVLARLEDEGGTGAAIERLRRLADHPKVIAIGEIGLDYHWMVEQPETQQYWFRQQLALARELDLPVSIHSRDAAEDTMTLLKDEIRLGVRGVMHCYSYSLEQAREYLKMGLYLGVGGVVTYKNGRKLKQIVQEIPLDRIVLETDCPYMAPTPHRGERNCSAYLVHVAEEIAALKGIPVEEVLKVTEETAEKIFLA